MVQYAFTNMSADFGKARSQVKEKTGSRYILLPLTKQPLWDTLFLPELPLSDPLFISRDLLHGPGTYDARVIPARDAHLCNV